MNPDNTLAKKIIDGVSELSYRLSLLGLLSSAGFTVFALVILYCDISYAYKNGLSTSNSWDYIWLSGTIQVWFASVLFCFALPVGLMLTSILARNAYRTYNYIRFKTNHPQPA